MKKSRIGVLLAAVASVLLVAECARDKSPDQELKAAECAVDSARNLQADLYAQGEFNAAQDSLATAKAEIEKQKKATAITRNYGKARSLLISTANTACNAAIVAQEGKKRAGVEADNSLSKATALLAEVNELVGKVSPALSGKPGLDSLKNEVALAETSINGAQAAKDGGDYIVASEKANGSAAKLDSIKTELKTRKLVKDAKK